MDLFKIYSHLPVALQNALCTAKGIQLDRQRYRGGYRAYYQQLTESEHATVQQILAYKEANLARMIDYAYRHCPYYRQTFKEAGVTPADFKALADLRKFPVLHKEQVRKYWMGMLSDEAHCMRLIPYHTSGSTGKALDFFWTDKSLQYYWATVWRARARAGVHKGEPHVNFTGKLVVPLGQQKPPYWRRNRMLNQYMLNMQHITREKVPDIVRFINDTEIKFVVGYSSVVHAFAMLVEELGLRLTNVPQYMFPSGEKLYDFQREQIERVFPGMRILLHYGFSENAGSASQCTDGNYHEDWESGHLELANPTARDATHTTGTLLATGYHNLGMPFIRYEIGDIATFCDTPCKCGLQSQVITDIEGKNGDYVITPEGARIMFVDYAFMATRNIKECQAIQREPGAITLRIVRRDTYTGTDEQKLIDEMHAVISPRLRVDFEYVSEIPRTAAGKYRLVISELK